MGVPAKFGSLVVSASLLVVLLPILMPTGSIPRDTAPGTWIVTGVRPHENASDHTADFIPISVPLTITSAVQPDAQ